MESDTTYEELCPLKEEDIQNAALIFGIVARETDSATAYLTGIKFSCPDPIDWIEVQI